MDKAPDAFRTISEVADELDVPQHVLRFWETRFSQIKPMKRSGGRRYYRRDDVELLRGIRHLLYGQGYTIRGVQRILREQGIKAVQSFSGSLALRHAVPLAEAEGPEFEAEEDVLSDEPDSNEPVIASSPRTSAPPVVRQMSLPAAGDSAQSTVAPAPQPIVLNRLSAEKADLLREALGELTECRRLLDHLLSAA